MKSLSLVIVSAVIFLVSCNEKRKVYPNEISFPHNVKSIGSNINMPNEHKSIGLKIIIYADSTGCVGCKLQLDMWKLYMESIRRKYDNRVIFLYYLQPRNKEELLFVLENEEFDYPVYIDMENKFGKLNGIHSDEVFLLDKNNKIIKTGNPLESSRIRNKYEEVIEEYFKTNIR